MASQEHLEATARAIAVLRAICRRHAGPDDRMVLAGAVGICRRHLVGPGHPTPEIPDQMDVDFDAAAVRSAVVSLDRVQDHVSGASRGMLDDAQAVLDDVQAELEVVDG